MAAEVRTINNKLIWRTRTATKFGSRTLMTLGPEGTSSEQAAKQMLQHHNIGGIRLFGSYEAAARVVIANKADSALLVANAYHRINHFYIASNLMPAAAFFFDTPNYVIATQDIVRFQEIQNPRIATHPAPAHKIQALLIQDGFERCDVDSTSAAAQAVCSGEADACLTTEVACLKWNFQPVSKSFPIPMLWTIFLPDAEV